MEQYFARIDDQNNIIDVRCVSEDYLKSNPDLYPGIWKETWRNGGIRKNFAAINGTYDPTNDAFIPEKIYNSWVLNTSTFRWEAPVPYPNDGNYYNWDEANLKWV